jgi:hypothetical protein
MSSINRTGRSLLLIPANYWQSQCHFNPSCPTKAGRAARKLAAGRDSVTSRRHVGGSRPAAPESGHAPRRLVSTCGRQGRQSGRRCARTGARIGAALHRRAPRARRRRRRRETGQHRWRPSTSSSSTFSRSGVARRLQLRLRAGARHARASAHTQMGRATAREVGGWTSLRVAAAPTWQRSTPQDPRVGAEGLEPPTSSL